MKDQAVSPGVGWRALRLEHFTFVMATGIVSTAIANTGAKTLSLIIFWIALIGYFVLVSGVLAGWVTGVRTVSGELQDATVRTLAFVAAGGVLAAHMVGMGWHTFALVLIIVSAVAWVILQYGALGSVLVTSSGIDSAADAARGRLRMFNGTWFLVVVSTQSLAVSLAAWAKGVDSDLAATLAVLAWGLGVLQLTIIAALVAARLLLAGVAPSDEVAPYWVFLGSGAISILGAAEVLGTAEEQIVLSRPVVGAVAMALWAFVTWMVPLTIALQVWQRLRPGSIRGYRAALWSMVFPIGMYGESSRQLGFVRHTGWLKDLGTWEAWIALAVWAVVMVGLVAAVIGRSGGRPAVPA